MSGFPVAAHQRITLDARMTDFARFTSLHAALAIELRAGE
jgi:hypothetical protein